MFDKNGKYVKTEWKSGDIVNADKLNKIESGIAQIDTKLDKINIIMPKPGTVEENTAILQGYLDLAKDNKTNVVIRFYAGEYKLNTCVIYSNTSLLLNNQTKLIHVPNSFFNPETQADKTVPVLFTNVKPFDADDMKITGYNGRSDIYFEGGIIDAYCSFVLCHGRNIKINGTRFINTKSDHVMQIGACKNVTIENCEFEGMVETADDRQYVEMIQIDWMTNRALPYWTTTALLYDGTVNDTITIDKCKFKKGQDDYAHLKTGIGSHSTIDGGKNHNIIIKNCDFIDFEYTGVNIYGMSNVLLINNHFQTTAENLNSMHIDTSDHVVVEKSNYFNFGRRAIWCADSSNVRIDSIEINKLTSDVDFIFVVRSNNVRLNGVTFVECSSEQHIVSIRDSSDVSAINCADVNCVAPMEFFNVYAKSGNVTKNISIRNTNTDKPEIKLTSGSNIIADIEETLWAGSIDTGAITLSDDITKFKDLKILLSWYGESMHELSFSNNAALIKNFNMPDDISGTILIYFLEMIIDKQSNTEIKIRINNGITLKDGRFTKSNSATIKSIVGKRIRY